MRLGLIIPANKKISPYIEYYTRIIGQDNISFRTLLWNKQGIDEEADMRFDFVTNDRDRKRMLIGHILFARKCREFIRKERIDKLIIFTNAPAFFLGLFFLKRFNKRYILDVRDDTPLRKVFPHTFARIYKNAYGVITSSYLYEKWINRECIICHNVDDALLNQNYSLNVVEPSDGKISIVYAGMMIEEKINIEILGKLGNNSAFEFYYIGRENTGKRIIEQYVQKQNLNNVVFDGEYKKQDITGIYRAKANLVNILRKNTEINHNALPNKFYDAVLAGVPVLVFKHNEGIARLVEEYYLGIIIEENTLNQLGNEIQRKYKEFNFSKYQDGRLAFLERIKKENQLFSDEVNSFLAE